MTLWIWLVAAIVLVLVGFETYTWFKRRSTPVEVTVAGDEPGAELVRAQMKIAILENRLAQSATLLEEEKEALHTQYRARLARTESAYQKQMVALRDRLQAAAEPVEEPPPQEYDVRMAGEVQAWLDKASAQLGLSAPPPETNADNGADEPAAETADQEAGLPQEPDAEAWQPAPEDEMPSEAEIAALAAQVRLLDEEAEGMEADDPADVAGMIRLAEEEGVAQTADSGADADVGPGAAVSFTAVEEALAALEEMAQEPTESTTSGDNETALMDELLAEADEVEEVEEVEPAASDPEAGEVAADEMAQQQLDAIEALVDELAEADTMEDDEPAASDPEAGESVADEIAQQQLDAIEALVDELAEADAVAELAAEVQEIEAVSEIIEDVAEADAEAEPDNEEAPAETAVDGDDSEMYEGRWSDLEDQARQRVMVRRLGTELDADYLDDEELLREMGMAPDVRAFGGYEADGQEDMMGGNGWVTDPLEEMAKHLAEETEIPAADVRDGTETPSEPDSDVWEAFVHEQAQANGRRMEDDGQTTDEEALDDAIADAPEAQDQSAADEAVDQSEPEAAEDEEDAMIAATVAAILSRVPDQETYSREQQEADPAYLPRANGKQQDGTNGAAKVPPPEIAAAGAEETVQKTAVPESPPVVTTVTLGSPARKAATAVAATAAPEMVMELPAFVWEREPITWEAAYFANTKLAEEPAVVRKDKEIDFDWGARPPAQGVPARTFSVRWSGAMALEPGEYRFSISAPDGVRLWLNGRLMISAWYDQSMQEYHRDIVWNGGALDVKLEHYENGGDARAFMTWERIG